MKSKMIMGIMLTLLIISMLTLAFNIQPAKAAPTTIIVPDNYPTIQAALDSCTSGDTVYVRAGTYNENIVLPHYYNITLEGESCSNTVVNGSMQFFRYGPFYNVTIKNFKILGPVKGPSLYGGCYLNFTHNIVCQGISVCCVYSTLQDNLIYGGIEFTVGYHWWAHSVTILNNTLVGSGIDLGKGSNQIYFTGNKIVNASIGILDRGIGGGILCEHIVISENNVSECGTGLCFQNGFFGVTNPPRALVFSNTFYNNTCAVFVGSGIGDQICVYHNNFINNSQQLINQGYLNVTYDDGYPSGGNYWSDYTGNDTFSGPYQNETGSDGIGDTPYIIDTNNTDNFPLMYAWQGVKIVEVPIKGEENATITGNVTITNALVTKNTLHFDASGPSGSTGWINVTFPMVNTAEIKVFINKVKLTPPPFPIITTNGTHYFIYFEFTLSTHSIDIQFEPTVPVGGISIPVNKLSLLAPYIGLTILLAVAVVTVAYVKKRKRDTEIIS